MCCAWLHVRTLVNKDTPTLPVAHLTVTLHGIHIGRIYMCMNVTPPPPPLSSPHPVTLLDLLQCVWHDSSHIHAFQSYYLSRVVLHLSSALTYCYFRGKLILVSSCVQVLQQAPWKQEQLCERIVKCVVHIQCM